MKFSEILGHQSIKANWTTSIRQGRVPHAQLLVGKEGNSALAMATAYAQYLSCASPSETDSCGQCPSCIKYQQLIHPDLHFSFPIFGADAICDDFIQDFRVAFNANRNLSLGQWFAHLKADNKKPNIPIKECRNIIKKLALRPYESTYKVLIMWLPEYLGKEGNVLLKLLEEPPQNTLFLLVTDNQEAILSTIISRTQYTRIPSYTYQEITAYLEHEKGCSVDIAKNAALMAEGNLSKAIELCSEIDSPQFDDFRQWVLDCYQGNMTKVIADMDKFSEKGKEGIKLFLLYGIQLFRACLLYAQQSDQLQLNAAEKEFVSKLSKWVNQSNIQALYETFNKAIFEIDRNGSVKLILINVSLRLKNCLQMAMAQTNNV